MLTIKWHVLLSTKTPIFDEENNLIGVLFQGNDITSLHTLDVGNALLQSAINNTPSNTPQNSYLIGQYQKTPLTENESEVLFYLLRNKSIKQISSFLFMQYRAVCQIIDRLKTKFNISSKSELIEKAIAQNFFNVIPPRLLRQQLSIELTE